MASLVKTCHLLSVHLLVLITIAIGVHSEECDSDVCIKLAEEIKASIDETVDPCQDFWSFACSKWQDRHEIPDDKKEVTLFDELQEELTEKMRIILEAPIMSEMDPFYLKNAKKFYKKCTNLAEIDEDDGKSLIKSFDNLGGFPLIDISSWEENYEHANVDGDDEKKIDAIFDFISELFKFGHEYKSIIHLDSMPDMTNTSRTILGISQGQMYETELPISQYKENYMKYIKDMLILLGAKDDESLKKQIDDVIQFELAFDGIDLSDQEKMDPASSYVSIDIPDLADEYPGIPWKKFLKGIFDIEYSEIGDYAILVNDEFFKKLPELLKKTPIKTVINFMLWSIVKGIPYTLSQQFRDRAFEFKQMKTGQRTEVERWKQCTEFTNNYFPEAISVGFVNAYFGRSERSNAEELVNYVRKEFNIVLDHLEWIDEETKKVATEKLDKMILAVGFPDEVLNKTVMDTHYMGCDMGNEKDSFFQIDRRINKWRNKKELENVGKLSTRDDWKNFAKVSEINAFYRILENAIYLPAGFLQESIYHIDHPAFFNFGALGFVTGHELTHGFDDVGKQFDPDGNDSKWWTQVTDEKFAEKAQCLIDQHNKFNVMDSKGTKLQVNGSNTVDENIADVGGLKIAFRAYMNYVKDKHIDTSQRLAGLKYQFKQLFYIKFATVWCNKERDEMLEETVTHEDHSINRMRVIGSIVNSEDFGESFNCPVGSPMNPEIKCLIW